jgi:hypothetical protein
VLEPTRRLARTPGGRPVKLAAAAMPVPDGFVFMAPHAGQGALLMNCIDPSVIDESDALSIDPALDPFSEATGFRARPNSAQYAPAFAVLYRAAQRRRLERIDAAGPGDTRRTLRGARARQGRGRSARCDGRRAEHDLPGLAHDADLRAFDLTLDPSDRRWGTVWGSDPLASNLGGVGFARVCTPESWPSTWSDLSSNASFERCGASIGQPARWSFAPATTPCSRRKRRPFSARSGCSDKQRIDIKGNHHGHLLAPGGELPQAQAGAAVAGWFKARFPA